MRQKKIDSLLKNTPNIEIMLQGKRSGKKIDKLSNKYTNRVIMIAKGTLIAKEWHLFWQKLSYYNKKLLAIYPSPMTDRREVVENRNELYIDFTLLENKHIDGSACSYMASVTGIAFGPQLESIAPNSFCHLGNASLYQVPIKDKVFQWPIALSRHKPINDFCSQKNIKIGEGSFIQFGWEKEWREDTIKQREKLIDRQAANMSKSSKANDNHKTSVATIASGLSCD